MAITTKIELEDIRVQDKFSYLNNEQGESLATFMIRVDDALRQSSPDAMSPGLINWSRKDLFTPMFIQDTQSISINYNPVGQSKIGTGRYEIAGTGKLVFNKYLPVSEIRGVTGRIYIGAMQLGSTVSVGVECYDAQRNELGTNGGFILNNEAAPLNNWLFKKSSCFGEANTGVRRLKPGTRYVKLFIKVLTNPGIVYFDESELTVFEQDERYLEISTNEVNWNVSEFFHKAISSDTTFVFTNDQDGKAKVLSVKNISSNAINVYFPTMKWQGGQAFSLINPGSTTVFTFIKMNGTVYASAIEEIF